MKLGRCDVAIGAFRRGAVLVTIRGVLGYTEARLIAHELQMLSSVRPLRAVVLDSRLADPQLTLAESVLIAPALSVGGAPLLSVPAPERIERAHQLAEMMMQCGVPWTMVPTMHEAKLMVISMLPPRRPAETDYAPL